MAASFYSNSQHVDFESVLSMDDQGMVSMFEALMASGKISSSHICALCVFFLQTFSDIISDHLLFAMAASFYSNSQHVDFESVLSMDDQGMVSMFEALMASGLAGFLGCPTVIYEDALVDFFENASVRDGDDKPVVDDPDTIINQFLQNLDSTSDDKDVEPVVEAATMDVVTAGEDQQVQEFLAQNANDDLLDADEHKSLEDILLEIPVDVPLPSAGMEITKIVMGQTIKIPGVTEKSWFLNSLPRIPADDKGKEILVEKNPIKGNPAQEHFFLICADIDLLVALRAKLIDEVALFFNSFSLKKLATINIDEMYKKEEQVHSGSSAVDRRVIELLSDHHVSILEELTTTARAHGLIWKKPCCSMVFEGSPRDRGAVIARTNTNTRSSCWIRTMILVDGVWTVEPCADKTALRSVQRSFAESAVPSVQFSLDQRQSSPTTADSSSSLRFDSTDVDATASSLPPVSQDFSAALADLQAILSEQIYESQSDISSRLHKIEQVLRDSLSDQAAIFKNLSQEARQESRTIDDVQTIRFNEFRKNILAQNASIFVGLDVHKEVEEVNAKVDIMASRLNAVQKDAEATKEALSHQLFEFQSQAQENQNILHAQLSELVDYIHRGSADKKGESGSRGLQQPSNVQMSASAERTPTFAQRVEMAQRHIVHTVLDADANRALLERQVAAERDRERRRREARALKRRRRD
ncbi:hypothetical protein F511_31857 [Dorcoceras hygrometricum]|uniref:Uncharacterized protein n=1 Tax=Dorcoceras hygrometricum TaxID=472368 RepID=A0A2Z7DFM2_9LAMI|nr:hypothetical protein F511_31857 [Dorcoceras hygrometricum]